MGINVSVCTEAGVDHPEWDFSRHSGDRDIPSAIDVAGTLIKTIGHTYDGDFLIRPSDVSAFVAEMVSRHPENRGRWEQLGDILRDPKWWVWCSY